MAYREDSGDITFAFTGDAMPTRRIAVHDEPEFLAVAGLPPTATTGDAYRVRDARSAGGLAQDPVGLQSAVAEVTCRGGRLAEIRLHPVDLGLSTPQRVIRLAD